MKLKIETIREWLHGFIWQDIFKSTKKKSFIQDTLKNCFIFQNMRANELRYLEKIVHTRDYAADELIFKENERGTGLYIIASGQVAIRIDKKQEQVTTLLPGTFFGEQAIIEADSVRTASAYAIEPTTLVALLKPDLVDIVNRNPTLGVKIVLQLAIVLSRRLRETTEKITKLSSHALSEYKVENIKVKDVA